MMEPGVQVVFREAADFARANARDPRVLVGTVREHWDSLRDQWMIDWEDGNVSTIPYRDHHWCVSNGSIERYAPGSTTVFDL